MPRILPILGLALALRCGAFAQTPPRPALILTLQDALDRAQANSQQLLSADLAARIAREDRVQAKAALLPSANWENGFVYTQPNGTDTGVFIANNGPRVYTNMGTVHGDVFAPGKRADYRMAIAAEAIARAKVEIASARPDRRRRAELLWDGRRASAHYANAQRSLREAQQFVDITQKQEAGGEVAHSDVVKAQLTLEQRAARRAGGAARPTTKPASASPSSSSPISARTSPSSTIWTVSNRCAAFPEIEALARNNNPEIRAAQAAVTQQTYGIKSARAGFLPTLSVDYFFGINANQYALHNEFGQNNLGSSVVASLNVPVWNWGAARSRVRQAELQLQQAQVDLSFTQRQLLANLNAFYLEASVASNQIASLKHSLDLSEESLRLTVLRYQAGEVTVLEVVDAQSTLFGARNAYDDGLARYRLALAALQTLTGAF